jgi:hypothetical protein
MESQPKRVVALVALLAMNLPIVSRNIILAAAATKDRFPFLDCQFISCRIDDSPITLSDSRPQPRPEETSDFD